MLPVYLKSSWLTPLILGVTCLVSYGLLVAGAGYYGDDLSYVWLGYKSHQMANFFIGNRPILGAYFDLMTRIIGPAAWQWHLFALVCALDRPRWLSGNFLDTLWPGQKAMTAAGAILFAVYPGLYLSGEAMTDEPYYLQFAALAGSMIATHPKPAPAPTREWYVDRPGFGRIVVQPCAFRIFLFLRASALSDHLVRACRARTEPGSVPGRRWSIRCPIWFFSADFFGMRLLGLGNASLYPITLFRDFLANPFQEFQALLTQVVSDIWQSVFGIVSCTLSPCPD